MKTTSIKLQSKNIFTLLFFGITLAATNKSFAQRIAPEKEISMFNLAAERQNKIERYSAKTCNEATYLQWHVKDEREDGIFLVQRSQNMMDFKIIGVREDIATEAFITLMFCFIDEKPLQGISYYRIMKIYKDGSYYYSDIETVEYENLPAKNLIGQLYF